MTSIYEIKEDEWLSKTNTTLASKIHIIQGIKNNPFTKQKLIKGLHSKIDYSKYVILNRFAYNKFAHPVADSKTMNYTWGELFLFVVISPRKCG